MKALIIYYSSYKGHTKMIAEAMAEVIGAELIKAEEFSNSEISDYDLIGFGSGVYDQKQHPIISEIIQTLDVKNKNVFVFSTSAAGTDLYNKDITELLRSKGAVLKGSFSCKGHFIFKIFKINCGVGKGHPNNDDLLNAKSFARKL